MRFISSYYMRNYFIALSWVLSVATEKHLRPVSPQLAHLRDVVAHIRQSYERPMRILTDEELEKERQEAEINSFIIH